MEWANKEAGLGQREGGHQEKGRLGQVMPKLEGHHCIIQII